MKTVFTPSARSHEAALHFGQLIRPRSRSLAGLKWDDSARKRENVRNAPLILNHFRTPISERRPNPFQIRGSAFSDVLQRKPAGPGIGILALASASQPSVGGFHSPDSLGFETYLDLITLVET